MSDEFRCPGNGKGKACKEMGTEQMKMGPYMKELERVVGFKSLRLSSAGASTLRIYLRMMAKMRSVLKMFTKTLL